MEKRSDRHKKKKKNKKGLKIFLIILLVIALFVTSVFAGMYFFAKSKLGKIQTTQLPSDPVQLGIDNKKVPDDPNIVNILLMGVDSRDPKTDPGHSDSMMILTVDKTHNKLKLSSIMRDSYVSIEGHEDQKITNAHEFGGALLSIKTVNENYNMNIMDYVQVNFMGLEKIIDSVGGIKLNLTLDEAKTANMYIKEAADLEHKKPPYFTHGGLQTLNGLQAVAYARIRYVGNNDFQRTERQRTVLTTVFKKLASTNIADIPKAADAITPYVETSLKADDMMSLATYILTHKMTTPLQTRVPYDGLYKNAVINGADVLTWDKQATIDKLHQFIFEDESK